MDVEKRKEAMKSIEYQLENGYLDLGLNDQDELKLIRLALNALGCVEQFRWERDMAIETLDELGLSLGQKIDGVYLSWKEYEEMFEYRRMYEKLCY